MESRLTALALVATCAVYLFLGGIGLTERGNSITREANYNLLARGLASGHLYLDKEAPPALQRLADPYDPAANQAFREDGGARLHDITYYKGRLYLYFGAPAALLIFLPWHLLTGGWLPHWAAVVLLCAAGLGVNLSLIRSVRSSVFPETPPWVSAAAVLVLGFGSYAPVLLARADMWEVPIAFSYFSVSVALRRLWEAFGNPDAPARWIALASLAFGAAFASRPTALPNAAILLLPFASREARRSARAWAAAVVPLGLCGAGVALYNALRFGNPFEFGQHYQLGGEYVARLKLFSPEYVWTNLRLYLFQPVRRDGVFPFTHEPTAAMLPAGREAQHMEHISGLLLGAPVLWAALAIPFFLRARRPGRRFGLMALSAAWVAFSSLLVVSLFFGASSRYQFEFAPALAILASIGVMSLESLARSPGRPAIRTAVAAALLFSCAFPTLYALDRAVLNHTDYGMRCLLDGQLAAADRELGIAHSLSPRDRVSRLGEGVLLVLRNRGSEARPIFEGLVRDYPDYATAHYDLAKVLADESSFKEAAEQYRLALQLEPGNKAMEAGLEYSLSRAR
jgi:tetratricopeptide (TPR) repeat protein